MHLFRFSTSVTHVVAVALHSTGARVALTCRLLCSRRQFQILPVACVGLDELHLHVDHAASGDRVL